MKTFKFLKPEWKALLLVFVLLMVQVTAELALPATTSDLVNIGVQQNGVPGALANKLSAKGMDDLRLLMDGDERQAVDTAYELADGVYRLKDGLTQEQQDKAESALGLPMALFFGASTLPGGEMLLPGLQSGQVTREMLVEQMNQQAPLAGETGEQFIRQAAAQYMQAEYKLLGED